MTKEKSFVALFSFLLIALIAAYGSVVFFATRIHLTPELQMGLLIVGAIATLMTVLFIIAAGFSFMSLTDQKQALGLPEGSIRAMIALVLIMVFIIFGIYLFRMVGGGGVKYVGNFPEKPKYEKIAGQTVVVEQVAATEQKPASYDVFVVEELTDDGKKLAHQLITILGTLVVAVSSFYFGSSVSSAAAKREQELVQGQLAKPAAAPVIKDVNPKAGAQNADIALKIDGAGFASPQAVRLLRGTETMDCTGISADSSSIRCQLKIDKAPGDKWDVLVVNSDGQTAKLPGAFSIAP